MNFVLPTPSLEHLAGVKIVSHLWNQHDTFAGLPPTDVDDLSENAPVWLRIKRKVKRKVSALVLPEQCKKSLVNVINPLGTEIIYWCRYHQEELDAIQIQDLLPVFQLCWTMHGTVDYAKTAELIVKDDREDVELRFELSAIHCLEDEARALFTRLSEKDKQQFVDRMNHTMGLNSYWLIIFFTRSKNLIVDGSVYLCGSTLIKRLFVDTLPTGNRAMCEYLFQRLSREETDQVFQRCRELVEYCRIGTPTGNMLYYLSLMNEEQQRYMFEECIDILLECLLCWPMQTLFMEVAKCGWKFMDDRDCSQVLCAIIHKIIDGGNDFDYLQLFRECLLLSSADYQQFHSHHSGVLNSLLFTGRVEFFKLIVEEAPVLLIKALCDRYHGEELDERVISNEALMECKVAAELNSANNQQDEELRLRSKYVRRLVMSVMACRNDTAE